MRISDWSSDVCSSDLPFGDFAAGPDLSRRWDDVRRSIAFAAERHGYSLVPAALCTRPVDSREVAEALLILQHSAFHEARSTRRSEERRVGKECVSTCRSRWSPYN